MKAKKAMKTFICILTVLLAVSLTACESDNGADDKTSPVVSITDSSTSSVHMEETKPDIESTEPEQEPTYYHAALCGAVVTEQDGSPRFTYVKAAVRCKAEAIRQMLPEACCTAVSYASDAKKRSNLRLRLHKIEMPYRTDTA